MSFEKGFLIQHIIAIENNKHHSTTRNRCQSVRTMVSLTHCVDIVPQSCHRQSLWWELEGARQRASDSRHLPCTCYMLKFGSAGSPRVACPTSPKRLELYGEARPKPPTLRRQAAKNTKNPSLCWGRAFWTESGSLISVSKSIPPPFWGYLKTEKSAVLIHFRTCFSFSKLTKCCKLQHFCVLEMHKTLQIPVFLKAK